MPQRLVTLLVLMALTALALPIAQAQDAPEPVVVELDAPDGTVLVGNYYALSSDDSAAPAVLLLHQAASRKEAWYNFIPLLLDAGYGVLAIDQRGHGSTPGPTTMPEIEQDVYQWLDWLAEQPGIDPDRLNLVGGSLGANLALRGMAGDERVITAVALSPGLVYTDATTDDAVTAIGDRPLFLVAAQKDTYSADTVRELTGLAAGDVQLRIYTNQAHGTGLFMLEDDLAPSIITWLDTHNR